MKPIIPLALMCLLSMTGLHQARAEDTDQTIRLSLPEYLDFLHLPNVTSRSSAEIRQNADWLEKALRTHGWTARQLADGDTPMVYAELPQASPARKTVLFYAHMDGQPVRNAEWAQQDPFMPVLRSCADITSCKTLPLSDVTKPDAGADWRIYARSAADDKAPIWMIMTAIDALKARGQSPAINVKLIIDSHEEGGGNTLGDVVKNNRDLLKADAVVIMDGPMHQSGRPTVVLGHRGVGVFRITVFGPRGVAHSGHYGNYVINPAFSLARLIASFKDDKGRVSIPGYYDGTDPEFLAAARSLHVPDDEKSLKKHWGVSGTDQADISYRNAMSEPTLNITGLAAGTMGQMNATIIPATAVASFDIRTVPGIDFDREISLVKGAVTKAGFHLVKDKPTEEERMTWPLLASLEAHGSPDVLFTRPDSPVGHWVTGALGKNAVIIPIMGGSVPSGPFREEIKAPIILLPLVNADDNQHAANENMRLGTYKDGVKELMTLLRTPLPTASEEK